MVNGLRVNRLGKIPVLVQQAGVIFGVAREPERRRMLERPSNAFQNAGGV